MSEITCSALLFDMDGVLLDSTHAVARVWKQWAIERGFNPEEVVRAAHGRPSLTTVKEYLPNADHEAENSIIEQRELNDLEGVVPLPGALELLTSLPIDRWAIVTSCTRALAEARLKAGGLPRPEKFVTFTDVVNGKPHPEPYIKGATLLGYSPEECVVVEDAPAGMRAGKASGARVIGLRTMVQDEESRKAGADWVVDDCSSVSLIRMTGALNISLH